jgi:recombinational DNA repair protein RecT
MTTNTPVRYERQAVQRIDAVPDSFPLKRLLEDNRTLLSAKLPHGYTYEGFTVELYFACEKNRDLLNVHPGDLIPALVDALDTGGTIGKDVHLLTFKSKRKETNDVSVAVDYKFKAELVRRAGGARSIDAFNVYANEPFAKALGTNPRIDHEPLPPSKRGRQIGSYAVAHMGYGVVKVQWCDIEMIEALRARSRGWSDEALRKKGEPTGCPEFYGCKTAVHRLVKLLPKNPKLTRLLGRIEQEERAEFEEDAEVVRVEAPTAGSGEQNPNGNPVPGSATVPPAASAPAQPASFDLGGVDIDEDEDRNAQVMTLLEASDIKVQSKALGSYTNAQLDKIEQTALGEVDRDGDSSPYVRLLVAVKVLREARKRGDAFEPQSRKSA